MSDNDLVILVPTRGRRENCERFLAAFKDTATCSDLVFITDPGDPAYEGMDWGEAVQAVLDPREYLVGKLNKTALAMADLYRVIAWFGDDCVPRTQGWDRLMLDLLDGEMGGTGWVYADDKRRQDVPEHWMCSSDIVKELGWYANPLLDHFYIDNVIAELGKRSGLIRFCPEAVVEHMHYSVAAETAHDEVYQTTEEKFGAADLQAFQQWRADQMPYDVARLRRKFSRDVAWVLGKVA